MLFKRKCPICGTWFEVDLSLEEQKVSAGEIIKRHPCPNCGRAVFDLGWDTDVPYRRDGKYF